MELSNVPLRVSSRHTRTWLLHRSLSRPRSFRSRADRTDNPKKTIQYMERTHLSRKEVDDVLGGEDSWKNVDSIQGGLPSRCVAHGGVLTHSSLPSVACKKECGNERAFYMQLQIRCVHNLSFLLEGYWEADRCLGWNPDPPTNR